MISCRFPALNLRLLNVDRMAGRGVGNRLGGCCCFVVCGAYQHTYMMTPSGLSSPISLRANLRLVSLLPPLPSLWRHAHFILNPLAVCPLWVSLRAKRSAVLAPGRGSIHCRPYGSCGDGPPPRFQTMEESAVIKSTTHPDSPGGSQRVALPRSINLALRHVSEVNSD